MMEDTPSNYNIPNGRLEGKSMGLKAILLFAKQQGIKLGEPTNPLPQIQEERGNTSGEDGGNQWRSLNNPISMVG